MKIVDNEGGFWTNVVLRKTTAAQAIENRVIPTSEFMRIIGKEMMNSTKGGNKHRITVGRGLGGKHTYHSFVSGTYQTGIRKRISPDGVPFAPLSETTLRIRKEVKGITRGAAFILRETSKHILEGIKILKITKNSVTTGWTGEDEKLVRLNENDRSVENPSYLMNRDRVGDLFSSGSSSGRNILEPVFVPARKVRGFSQELLHNLSDTINRFLKL